MSDSSQSAARPGISSGVAAWALRIALSTAFLAAVADRFGLCGGPGSNNVAWGAWRPFVDYTGTLLFFLPPALVSVAAVTATAAEVILGVWLLTGWQLRQWQARCCYSASECPW